MAARCPRSSPGACKSIAFRVRKNRKAHYTLMNIDAPPAAIAEMERQMAINEDILRFMTVKVEALEEGPSAMLQKRDRDDRGERGFGGDRGFGGGGGRDRGFGGGGGGFGGGGGGGGDAGSAIVMVGMSKSPPKSNRRRSDHVCRSRWRRRPFFRRRKTCPFSGPNAPKIDYKDVRSCSATSPSAARSFRPASRRSPPRSSASSRSRSSAPASCWPELPYVIRL
jgi:hypothetical protein